jgi:hypothetical protein
MKVAIAAGLFAAMGSACLAQSENPEVKASAEPAIAVVLGRKIAAADRKRVTELILRPLFEQYARAQKLEPTPEEVDRFVTASENQQKESLKRFRRDHDKLQEELKAPTLSEQERKDKETQLKQLGNILQALSADKPRTADEEKRERAGERAVAEQFVKAWKVNKSLYEKYGGRVIFQQAGPEPLDAYRKFLLEQEQKGAFRIDDEEAGVAFWKYFKDDSTHVFLKDQEKAADAINRPWWMRVTPAQQ